MKKARLPLFAITILSAALATTSLQAADDKDKPAAGAAATAAASPAKKGTPFHGKITSVDAAAKTITLEGKEAQRVVMVTDSTKLKKAGGAATWDDLKVGEEVGGSFKKTDDGKMEALTLRVGPKPEKKKKKEKEAAATDDTKTD